MQNFDTTWLLVVGGTLLQTMVSVVFSVGLGVPLAHVWYTYEVPGRRFWPAIATLFFIMPSKLAALAVQTWYGTTGLTGIIVSHVLLNMPFVFFVTSVAYRTVDRTLVLAARDLGASSWQCYRDTIMPFLVPAIASSVVVIGVLCFSSQSIPTFFGYAVYHATPDIKLAQAYCEHDTFHTLLYALTRLSVVIPISMSRSARSVVYGRLSGARSTRKKITFASWRSLVWCIYALIASSVAWGPLLALCWRGIDGSVIDFWRRIVVGNEDPVLGIAVHHVISNSFYLAATSSLIALGVGWLVCLLFSRLRSATFCRWLSLSAAVPFVLGGTGCGILFAWLADVVTLSSFVLAVACHTLLNYPYVYRVLRARYDLFERAWTLSAQSLGATSLQALRTVELPFIGTAARRALCTVFGLSLTEIGTESVLGGKLGMTMPMAIRLYRQHGVHEGVMGLSLITLLLTLLGAYGILSSDE